jgi:hypothetical protein
MDTKISFNGAELDSKGSGTAGFTVLSGSVLVRIDEDSGDTQAAGKVNVSITTKLGVISTTNGTFSVREDKTGTIIAVSAGTPVIRISGGADGGQVEIPKGSVLWLEKKEDGTVETKIVNSATGTMVVIKPDGTRDTSQKAPAAFDRVVIDTAPIIPISDSLVLGQLVDHVFMVVRCNRTPAGIAQDAIQKLNQAGIALSGIILNRQTQRSRGYGYYYHNYYENPKEVIKSPSSTLDFPPANHVPHSSERSAPLNASRSSY